MTWTNRKEFHYYQTLADRFNLQIQLISNEFGIATRFIQELVNWIVNQIWTHLFETVLNRESIHFLINIPRYNGRIWSQIDLIRKFN